MRTTRYASLLILTGTLLAAVPAHAFNTKAGYDRAREPGDVTPERVKSDFEAKAQKLQDSWPRTFTFYGTFVRNSTDFAALARYTVYLFSVLTQKAEELPVKRIFIRAPRGEEIPVPNVLSWRTPVEQGSATAKRFGPYRQDGYYLIPTGALMREGQLIMDLTAGRTEWALVDLPSSVYVSQQGKIFTGDPPPGARPELKTLQDFIRREFPGFPVPQAVQ